MAEERRQESDDEMSGEGGEEPEEATRSRFPRGRSLTWFTPREESAARDDRTEWERESGEDGDKEGDLQPALAATSGAAPGEDESET